MQKMEVGAWVFKVSSEEKIFDQRCIQQALDYLQRWQKAFPHENTWAQREFRVPSILVRLDCIAKDGVLGIYEIEERPSVGLSVKVNPTMADKLTALMSKWPQFHSVVSGCRKAHDDPVWIKSISLAEAKENNDLLLVRAEPHEKDYHAIAYRSVSTVLTKGYKGYGPELGLWSPVTFADFEDLPWEEGFCLKPMQGSKTHNVEIWHPRQKQYRKRHIGGLSTRSKIARTLQTQGNMYCQKLIHPLEIFLENQEMMFAHRVYFGYDPEIRSYIYLGGVWNARPNMMIHGASDAIFGPVN